MQGYLWKRAVLFMGLIGIFVVSIIPLETPLAENSDKAGHFIAYFILCLLFCLNRAGLMRAFIFAVVYGVSMEIIQYFLPYRSFSLLDIAANGFGAGLFILIRRFSLS
jgi:VanZ family protein